MPRPRGSFSTPSIAPTQLVSWAESLGEALGRGVARGINAGLGGVSAAAPVSAPVSIGAPRRGRPPKMLSAGAVSSDKQCKVEGCVRPARSKGLCSAHYQAERRRQQAKAAGK